MNAPIRSMTGFARRAGNLGTSQWSWEIKTVNNKGLDLRLRVPPGFDAIEHAARSRIPELVARGTCYATLAVSLEAAAPDVRINQSALATLIALVDSIDRPPDLAPASLDGLLAIRGVVEIVEKTSDAANLTELATPILKTLEDALDELRQARQTEGAVLERLTGERLARIARLVEAADHAPGRTAESVRKRLEQKLGLLLSPDRGLDPIRLHQEAALMATRADIQEELDRLRAHHAAMSQLLIEGGPVGRRLDFLAQELGREASTLCAKSNDAELSVLGLDLRAQIEQLREQIQNVE